MQSDYEPTDGFGFREGENSLGMDAEEQELWKKAQGRYPDTRVVMQRRCAPAEGTQRAREGAGEAGVGPDRGRAVAEEAGRVLCGVSGLRGERAGIGAERAGIRRN